MFETQNPIVRVAIVHVFEGPQRGARALQLSPEDALAETIRLAEAMDWTVVAAESKKLSRIQAATYIGEGMVNHLHEMVEKQAINKVVIDAPLTGIQQRNLEERLGTKVIDRTQLILDIFARRAQTREGVLQVEMAKLTYEKSKLVRSWTHLERQRGSLGFIGGPGESQIEIDRRLIDQKIDTLKEKLEDVQKTRALHRKGRQGTPVVALVGYTNAGKSTLFNRLTKADVFVMDALFATLDPTMRAVDLTSHDRIILSDTVGFISDLPHILVAAFRSTLEEVLEADVLLHVHDSTSTHMEIQTHEVDKVLTDIGVNLLEKPILHVYNKADALDPERHQFLENNLRGQASSILVSAKTGDGMQDLLDLIQRTLHQKDIKLSISFDASNGDLYSWIHAHAIILEKRMDEEGRLFMTIKLSDEQAHVLDKRWGRICHKMH